MDQAWCSKTGYQAAKSGCAVHLKTEKLFGKAAGMADKAETYSDPNPRPVYLPLHKQPVLHQLTLCPQVLDSLGRPPEPWEGETGQCHALHLALVPGSS